MALLEPTAIAKLESLAVKARVIVEGALSGMHRAKQRGSSVEFAEHKEYTQGDEIRHIDWKILGKADRYYVKQFEQESELTCYLVVDASGSMSYQGNGISKQSYACNLAAAMAYLLINQRDRVGVTVFGDGQLGRYAPPRAKPAHLRTILNILESAEDKPAKGNESIASALERVAELARNRRGLVLIFSDLFDSDQSPLPVIRHLRARGHDTVLFHILDRDEVEFPFDGLSVFESLENDDKVLVDPASVRRIYQERMKEFIASTEAECLQSGIEYHLSISDQPFESVLMNFLAARMGISGTKANAR